MNNPTILIVAKAPVAGLAKTRLAKVTGNHAAARIAAAALLDTIEVCASSGWPVVIAMTGDLNVAENGDQIRTAMAPHRVIPQRGDGLAERLVNAHNDAASPHGVIQVGMDTPQLTCSELEGAADALRHFDAALGMAVDGGWWVLALRDADHAAAIADVPISTDTTGARTLDALRRAGARVSTLPILADVDEWPDAQHVADLAPQTRFANEVARACITTAALQEESS